MEYTSSTTIANSFLNFLSSLIDFCYSPAILTALCLIILLNSLTTRSFTWAVYSVVFAASGEVLYHVTQTTTIGFAEGIKTGLSGSGVGMVGVGVGSGIAVAAGLVKGLLTE